MDKLCNHLEGSNRTNQFQTQVVTRSGQPVVGAHTRTVQDGRKTSRSHEIDVNSFHEETVSSDRSGQPVMETNTESVPDGCQTRSCHESIRFNVGDETLRDRSGQPVVNHDDSSHEQTMLNEVNMDFRIPGLPHSVVKHAQTKSSIQTVQSRVKTDDSGRGNVELFELLETDPKTQRKACLSHWSEGKVYCTCGHLLMKKQWSIEVSLNTHWTFFQFQNTSSRREDLTATDMGNFQETKNITWPII